MQHPSSATRRLRLWGSSRKHQLLQHPSNLSNMAACSRSSRLGRCAGHNHQRRQRQRSSASALTASSLSNRHSLSTSAAAHSATAESMRLGSNSAIAISATRFVSNPSNLTFYTFHCAIVNIKIQQQRCVYRRQTHSAAWPRVSAALGTSSR